MDPIIAAAAHALAAGDPFGALNCIALRDDAMALALRGMAMAQLGDLQRAKNLLKKAARSFGPREAVARARCIVAGAEIALVTRELSWPIEALDAALQVLIQNGDRQNAAYAQHLKSRYCLLIGCLREAENTLEGIDAFVGPPAFRAACELVVAGVAMRRFRAAEACAALARSADAARQAGIPALVAEVEAAATVLNAPVARLIEHGREKLVLLDQVEALLVSPALTVDACQFAVREPGRFISLKTRPVLFALVRALAEAWPGDASRAILLERAFRAKFADESHRARLRVEIGRLRKELRSIANVTATKRGFCLVPISARWVVILARPVEGKHAPILAMLADGEAWSSFSLALALGTSQRSVQRALEELAIADKVKSFGRGRACRWIAPPVPGFPTALLLRARLSDG